MNENDYKNLEKEMADKFEKELEEKFQLIVNNPKPSIEDLWILPEEKFDEWRRKYDYPKLIDSFNSKKPSFIKWKSEFNITDEELISNEISPFLQNKGISGDKTLYLLEQTFDSKKKLIVAHVDLSQKKVMFPEKGEAYILLKKFNSYADWCDKNNIEFDLFNINQRQAPGHKLERVWLDTGYELLKMGGLNPPVNGFGVLLRGKRLEFVNLCGLKLEGTIYYGTLGNLECYFCTVDNLFCNNLNLPYLSLWYCSLENLKIANSEISQWIFWQCHVTGDIFNSKLRVIKIFGGAFTPYIKDTQLIAIEASHKGLKHSSFNYTYRMFKKIFDDQGDDDEASKYYVREKELDRESSKGWKYILKSLSYYYWEYGKKPQRIIYISIMAILICGFIYWLLPQSIRPVNEPKDFLDSIYFSTVTFTTLGYGDLSPIGWLRLLSLLEAFFGAINIGFLVAGFSKAKY